MNGEKNIFIHVDIDTSEFYKNLFNYFFHEDRILNYISMVLG